MRYRTRIFRRCPCGISPRGGEIKRVAGTLPTATRLISPPRGEIPHGLVFTATENAGAAPHTVSLEHRTAPAPDFATGLRPHPHYPTLSVGLCPFSSVAKFVS